VALDPLLTDPTAGNVHLQADSPCIDAGDPAYVPATDFEGDARPQGPAGDMGADEFVGAGPAAPHVTITAAVTDVRLTWTHLSANTAYEIWRAPTPYFTPGAGAATLLASGLPPAPLCTLDGDVITCTDPAALGNPASNPYYIVRALATTAHADAAPVAGFTYALQR
jgi:hypothetical protein